MTQANRPPKGNPPKTGNSECRFWDCKARISRGYTYCYQHYRDSQDGLINQCPACGMGKDAQYEVCQPCYRNRRNAPASRAYVRPHRKESSPAWQKGDASADRFFVYILKLADGAFYAGQTRELRERLSEHRDNLVASTQGKEPKLVWFAILPSRDAAASTEVELKQLIDRNPREVRRMVIGFSDMMRELDFS